MPKNVGTDSSVVNLTPTIVFTRLTTLLLLIFSYQALHSQNDIKGKLADARQLSQEGAFEKAALLFKEVADYWQARGRQDSAFFYRYREASHYSNAYQFQKAARLFGELIQEMESHRTLPDFSGRVYYNHGSNFVYLNEFGKALAQLDKCLNFESQKSRPDSLYIAKATEWKGLTYSYLGDLEKAKDLIEEALNIRYLILETDAQEIGYNLNSLGLIYHELNDLEKADSIFSEALRVLGKHLPPFHAHLSSIRSNISTIKLSLGDFHAAKSLMEQSITAHLSEKRFHPLISDYFNMGSLYLSLEDSEHALPYMQKALTLADSLLPFPHYTRANLRDGLGGIYFTTGNHNKADSVFRLALDEKLALFGSDHPEVGRSYYSLGLIAKEKGDIPNARINYSRSFRIRKSSLGARHPATADVLFSLAELEWEMGSRQKAIDQFRTCLNIYEQKLGLTNQSYLQTALRLFRSFTELNQQDSLDHYLLRSWSGVFGKFPATVSLQNLAANRIRFVDSYVLHLIEFHLSQLNAKGDLVSVTDLEQGRQVLQLTDQLLEQLLPLVNFENANQEQIASIRRIYHQGLLLVEKGLQKQAEDPELQHLMLYCLQQSRAMTIRAAIQNRAAMKFANVPEEIVREDRQLREKMRFVKARSGEEENMQELFFQRLEEWRAFQRELQTTYPQWFELRYARQMPDKEIIADKLIRENASLLVYFDMDTTMLALVMNRDRFETFSLPLPEHWSDSVKTYRRLIEQRASPGRIAALGYFFYQTLWAPLEKTLDQRVIVVPDGPLFYLNFETLITRPEKSPSFENWPWLLRKHEIFYSNQIPEEESERNPVVSHVLAIAPSFSETFKQRYLENLPPGKDPDTVFTSWTRTPWSTEFVKKLGKKGMALTGLKATKAAFLRNAGDAGILHFGTHAMLKDEDPLLSFLALTPQPEKGDDGYLYAYELYNLPLTAQLTVLTACQTGSGVYQKGQGVISLAHAFQYAGCPAVIYSLWSIDDQQSNVLLEIFYRELARGNSFSSALRQAKLDYLEAHSGDLAAPFYWAGMVLIGENSSLDTAAFSLAHYWWIPLVVLTLGLFSWLFLRNK